jgi:hypothetical protein
MGQLGSQMQATWRVVLFDAFGVFALMAKILDQGTRFAGDRQRDFRHGAR